MLSIAPGTPVQSSGYVRRARVGSRRALLAFFIDLIGNAVLGWVPERRWARVVVLGLYLALLIAAVVLTIEAL